MFQSVGCCFNVADGTFDVIGQGVRNAVWQE